MENKTEERLCLKCQMNTPHYHNKGVSKKTGKPYENYKCSVCQETEWVNSDQPRPAPKAAYRPIKLKEDVNWDEIRERKEDSMEWLNSKNNAALIVAALIEKGELDITNWYEAFTETTKGIYGFNKTE